MLAKYVDHFSEFGPVGELNGFALRQLVAIDVKRGAECVV
jgi:hypothetical protein